MIVPHNALLYLALIRPVFCIGALIKPNWNKAFKKKVGLVDEEQDVFKQFTSSDFKFLFLSTWCSSRPAITAA